MRLTKDLAAQRPFVKINKMVGRVIRCDDQGFTVRFPRESDMDRWHPYSDANMFSLVPKREDDSK